VLLGLAASFHFHCWLQTHAKNDGTA
jgi:hypothetical protein